MSAPGPINQRTPGVTAGGQSKGELYSMIRKLIISLTPLLAVALFAVIPAVSQAAKWEHCVSGTGSEEFNSHQCNVKAKGGNWVWQSIPETPQTKEQVKFAGRLTLNVAAPAQKIECYARGKAVIWNEGGNGHDEITQFINAQCVPKPTCSPLAIVPENLPYPSTLKQGPPVRDEITGIKVHVACNTILANFLGTLSPKISTENGAATFDETAGKLETATGIKAIVEGTVQVEQENGWAVRAHA
jgi:hypothetical protein